MSMTAASSEYFNRVAGAWDTLRAGYFGEWVREAAIAKAYLQPDAVVADVGTGTGFVAVGLAPLVKQVYALDGSPAMLEVARLNLASFANVVYQVTDGARLPLDDASVDAVFANMYLHHCPDPAAAVREMVRVLRPGGRLVLTDMDQHDHEWLRTEMADEWLGFDRAQIKTWLRAAGPVNVIVGSTGQSCCATAESAPVDAEKERAEVSVFVAAGSRRVSGVREAVQANYGALAEGAGGGCSCGEPSAPGAAQSCCASSSACWIRSGPPRPRVAAPRVTPWSRLRPRAGGDTLLWFTGYSPEQLAEVPAEAAQLSLGCGNPTAIASLQPGEAVLDIGSGAGIDAFYAARRVGPAGKVIGLDMTPAMLERARSSAQAAGFSQVEFRQGQAEDMPIEDGSIDVVLSNCVINLCEDKGRVFEEAYRVLKDGGRLSISDMVSDRPFPAKLAQRSHALGGLCAGRADGRGVSRLAQTGRLQWCPGRPEPERRRSGRDQGVQPLSIGPQRAGGRDPQ